MSAGPDPTVRLELEFSRSGETISGVVRPAGGSERTVGGWLELLSVVEALLADAGGGPAATPP